jgi:predicted HTH transcriptional regulator
MPEQVTPEMASMFQSWLTAYQKRYRSLGTLGLKRKHQKHLDLVVELAGERGSITRRELQLAMRMSAAAIDKYTHELVFQGRLRHVGAPSHGRYERV